MSASAALAAVDIGSGYIVFTVVVTVTVTSIIVVIVIIIIIAIVADNVSRSGRRRATVNYLLYSYSY
jgi:hypothetical protein